jgi:hypothetical protein
MSDAPEEKSLVTIFALAGINFYKLPFAKQFGARQAFSEAMSAEYRKGLKDMLEESMSHPND